MQLNPSEISELIRSKIQNLDTGATVRTQGTVVSISDGIARVHGLSDAMAGEMLEFPNNTFGLALNLERDSVGAVILGEYEHISEGDTVKCTGRILSVPVGPELIGRVVNSLGQPIDGKGPINAKESDVIEKVAPGVIWRKSVSQPVQTGLKSIDSMVPIGRGQRELIIGDRQTGKTGGGDRHDHQPEGQGALLHLRRHRPEGVVDQERDPQARRVRRDGIHDRRRRDRVGIGGDAVHRALFGLHDGRVFPRPRAGRAHHLRRPDEAGVGVPQVSLLLRVRRAAKRIPGDVFYLHSRLLERAARVSEEYVEKFTKGAGEGQDGLAHRAADHRDAGGRRHRVRADQRDLDHRRPDLPRDRPLQRGVRPAINAGISVSRVGGARRPRSSRSWAAACAWRSRSTASSRRSRSSRSDMTKRRASSSTAGLLGPSS
jgi:F-type H+-transporting ATPase subunit alpha